MRLQEIMTTDVVTIGPDEAARTAWSRMERARVRHLVVAEGKRVLGVLSERDLGGRQGAAIRRGRTVRDLMTPQVAVATPATTLRQAANLMRGRLIGSLPVVDDSRLVGIVTATDVLAELGRGSSRPEVRAKRQSMRLPPASARAAKREGPRARAPQGPRRANKGKKSAKGRGGSTAGEGGPDNGSSIAIRGRITPALGRRRVRQPDSRGRTPLPARLPRAEKRSAGRTVAAETPAHIRSIGSVLDAEDKRYLRRKLGRKLGKFASAIERTSVRVEDVNGPRGGVDKRCRIKVVLSGLPSVVVEERHHSLQAALEGALARAERAVRQATQRRSMNPRREGTRNRDTWVPG
ncbi:MAG TPA: CBS domain-containing protein [Hyphomicrobiaceae bacterium]|nr:CBS domain-containing protein [Hyphomicrobiaceae bacterium]